MLILFERFTSTWGEINPSSNRYTLEILCPVGIKIVWLIEDSFVLISCWSIFIFVSGFGRENIENYIIKPIPTIEIIEEKITFSIIYKPHIIFSKK